MQWFQIDWLQAFVFMGLACLTGVSAFAHEDTYYQIELLTQELEASPNQPDLLLYRGRLYLEHANYPEAIADFTQALKADPETLDPLIFRGQAYFQSGQSKDGLADLDRFIKEGRPHYQAHATRAEIRAAMGDVKGAAEDLATANRLQPRPEQYIQHARLLVQAKDPEGAAAILEEGLRALKSPITLVLELVNLEIKLKQYGKALDRAAYLESLGGNTERWRILKGDVLVLAGRVDDATKAYTKALAQLEERIRKGRITTYVLLDKTRALAGLGRIEEAIHVYNTLDPAARNLPGYEDVPAKLGLDKLEPESIQSEKSTAKVEYNNQQGEKAP